MKSTSEIGKGIKPTTNYNGVDCGTLPVYIYDGKVLSCWKMSFKERLSALIFGKVWLCMKCASCPPAWMMAREKDVFGD